MCSLFTINGAFLAYFLSMFIYMILTFFIKIRFNNGRK
jgi:hypothetical protein